MVKKGSIEADIFEQHAKIRLKAWKKKKRKPYQKKRVIFPVIIAAFFFFWLVLAFIDSMHYQTTDDAFVEGRLVSVAPKAKGHIIELLVDDNDYVEKGQLIAQIDKRDYENKVKELKSALKEAKAQKNVSISETEKSEADLSQSGKSLLSAKHKLDFAQNDFLRYTKLKKEGLCTKQEYDTAKTGLDVAKEEFKQAKDRQNAMAASLKSFTSKNEAALANIEKIEAEIEQAELMLSYTEIHAPISGNVSSRNVELGNYVSIGQPLMVIVSPEVWVVANYKETQLTKMKKNQPVTISVDTYPNKKFKGKVDSIQRATGAKASLFPPENAVGSYVKVVQRIPVKITFEEDYSDYNITPGMSVVPRVKIR
ncbi:MAG: HlyD family secretion protein [Candidatus Gastranaerophilales bacterium]|nr:HlyD family secretion protein [Candidatus Gastranaerophilales bacterium]